MKFSRMRDSGGIKTLPAPSTSPSGSSQEAASLLAKYTQLPYSESGDADIATDASSSYISVSQDGSTLNVSSANYSPGVANTQMPDIVKVEMILIFGLFAFVTNIYWKYVCFMRQLYFLSQTKF